MHCVYFMEYFVHNVQCSFSCGKTVLSDIEHVNMLTYLDHPITFSFTLLVPCCINFFSCRQILDCCH